MINIALLLNNMEKVAIIGIIIASILSGWPKKEKTKEDLTVKLEFDEFPVKHTCDGDDISPKIMIKGLKEEVKSLAIIMDDPDAPFRTFNHWLIWNIEPTDTIPENIPKEKEVSAPIKAIQGINDFGEIGYGGPCPPPGKPHRYYFRIYALDALLDLEAGADRKILEKEMEGHIIQYGEAMAKYGR